MVPFKASKLTVKRVELKACTTALGGSVSIVDRKRSSKNREVYTKVNVPLSVARQFIKYYGVRRYIKPVPAALVYYGDHVVALERHPSGSLGDESGDGNHSEWNTNVDFNINNYLKPQIKHGDWCTDGLFVFRMDNSQVDENLSSDGRFQSVSVQAIKLADLFLAGGISVLERMCLKYTTTTGHSAMSPPIWKNLNRVGVRQLNKSDNESEEDDDSDSGVGGGEYQFDRIDEFVAVNLSFVLRAGHELADLFGYDAIEPLRLDKLMTELNTVNLPNLSKDIKQTYDTGIKFTHAVAWLLGKLNQVDTLDSHLVIRSLLKHLTTKGIFRKNAFDAAAVYVGESDHTSVPLMTREQATNNDFDGSELSFEYVVNAVNGGGQSDPIPHAYAED